MLRKIRLYGFLAEKYGSEHAFDISNIYEAVSALACNYKSFREDFIKGSYKIVLGDFEKGFSLTEEILNINFGMQKEVHIVPVPEGAKSSSSKAIMMIVAGAAMMTPFGMAAFAAGGLAAGAAAAGGMTSATMIAASVGLSLALTGVSTLLAPTPKVSNYESRNENQNSFLLNGAVNSSNTGSAIPLCYGTFLCNTAVISSGLTAEAIAV